jgi:hypothetical protein
VIVIPCGDLGVLTIWYAIGGIVLGVYVLARWRSYRDYLSRHRIDDQ